jgi:NADPH2:quinone reductase
MRAVLCHGFDGIESLQFGETLEPAPAVDEVLVEVHAASVSYMDYLMVSGGYQLRPPLPYVPGTDAAGVVVAVGDNVTRFQVGDRVACASWYGGYAERMVAKALRATRLPDNLDFAAGSTVLHVYLTAWYALVDRANVQANETVLVTGAAGGVGLACVELAHALGARVIAAIGSAAKADIVRRYGADDVIDYSSEDVRDRVKVLTGGEGVDVCVENVGGKLFASMARLMRWNGRLMPIGFASGEIPSIPMNLPLLKNYSIVGVFSGAWSEKFQDQSARAGDIIMNWISEGRLRPHVDRVLPLERAADAMRAIADRAARGRIVLQVKQGAP